MHIADSISTNIPAFQEITELTTLISPDQVRDLADPSFHVPACVDLLLGVDFISQFVTDIQSHSLGPFCSLKTSLGIVILGEMNDSDSTQTNLKARSKDPFPFTSPINRTSATSFLCNPSSSSDDGRLENILKSFWEIEEISSPSPLHSLEQVVEDNFLRTTTRESNGRYVVSLPFNPKINLEENLSNTFTLAVASLKSLESRFQRDPVFSDKYKDFIEDFLSSGHMSPVSSSALARIRRSPHFFIPHHGVIKKGDPSAPLRVVFNGSAKTKSHLSLNDCLLPGPKLQSDLVRLLVQFRMHKFIIATDIKQMFRQIQISPVDQPFQLIVWRDNPDQPFQIFKINTVTYGLTSSPFLAIRTLHQLIADEGQYHPSASNIILNNTFVDDLLFGSDDTSELLQTRQDVINLLSKGQFSLKKWKSNSPALLDNLPFDHLETLFDSYDADDKVIKVLGVKWNHITDSFGYAFTPASEVSSKRQLLSQIAKLFDPVGWLSPLVIRAKVIMQSLCQSSLQWDDPLPEATKASWLSFCQDLSYVQHISIPRHARLTNPEKMSLHSFADASNSAYGAAIYLVSNSSDQRSASHLLISKSRVAPTKTQSIPRLELCAALLCAELTQYTISILQSVSPDIQPVLWTDSSVVLAWLKREPSTLNTFVANRVAKIQAFFPINSWKHVPSALNPADLVSRGTSAQILGSSRLWWHGPDFIMHSEQHWPSPPNSSALNAELPDVKVAVLVVAPSPSLFQSLLERYSKFSTLQNVLAFMLRFAHNCAHPEFKLSGPLSLVELRKSFKRCVLLVQQDAFSKDLRLLSNNSPPSSRLRRLKPFIDEDGLIRVGGRISRSTLSDLAIHPYVLPSDSKFTRLLIMFYHHMHSHVGYQTLHNILVQEFWILSPRRSIKSALRSCISCFRTRPTPLVPPMADLPSFRVRQIRPFSKTGLDFAGPFVTRPRKTRDKTRFKSYLCVFVCMATKAVHLEILTDMSRDCFIVCFDRFVARRGYPLELFSDQGTTFVAADKFLRQGYRELFSSDNVQQLASYFSNHGIRWNFNPPSAPHFGGLWETAVKSSKALMYRSIGQQSLTHEQLETLFIRIEASLNSRPLTSLSSDPSDLTPLTPGHFLIGTSLITLPRPSTPATGLSLQARWKLLDTIFASYWKQWHASYLHTLQQRVKWHDGLPEVKIGDLVLIKSENYPPLSWPMARVTSLLPDSKGVARSATVKTANGVYNRPLVKLCPLPIGS